MRAGVSGSPVTAVAPVPLPFSPEPPAWAYAPALAGGGDPRVSWPRNRLRPLAPEGGGGGASGGPLPPARSPLLVTGEWSWQPCLASFDGSVPLCVRRPALGCPPRSPGVRLARLKWARSVDLSSLGSPVARCPSCRYVIDVVAVCSPGPGLSCARRGTDVHGERDRSSRPARGPLVSPPRLLVVCGRQGCGPRPDRALLVLGLEVLGGAVVLCDVAVAPRLLPLLGSCDAWVALSVWGRAAPPPPRLVPSRGVRVRICLGSPWCSWSAPGCSPRCPSLSGCWSLPLPVSLVLFAAAEWLPRVGPPKSETERGSRR